MGRHSAPTALTRAAKRAGVATSAVAAVASITVAGGATAQAADTIPGASAAEQGYGKLLQAATAAASNALKQGEKGVAQVVATYNGIPVLADVIKVTTANGVTVPVIGNLRLGSTATDAETSVEGGYTGIAGSYLGGAGWSWGDVGGTGGAPVLYVSDFADPTGIVKGAGFLSFPVLNIGNGGFNIGENYQQTWVNGEIKGLVKGDSGFHLPYFSLDDDGLQLSGPKIYGGPDFGKTGSADFGLSTGSIVFDKATGKITLTGPALSNETWDGPAKFAATGYGTLTGGLNTGSLVLNGADSKWTAPSGSVRAETIDLAPVGKINVGGSLDGGTVDRNGVNGVGGNVTGGTTTTKTTSVQNKNDPTDPSEVTSTTDTTVTTNNQVTLGGSGSSSSMPVVSGDHTATTREVVTNTPSTPKDAPTTTTSDTTTTTTTSISTDGGVTGPETTSGNTPAGGNE
ncbi:hypothetical protein [Tsukamurella pseudospumae]|uniref:Uncharacterized protein n=1 Tax=Tsukamurella pseudospumae TaxID=239498 RepID=A0A137ZYJ7_9ACTN|nr:hypothetical protein [Tsukamurella pseudospumae]KXP03254.1 hypothetical protein AXK60_15525 [Tsukamurella pseudospumae]